MRSKEDSCDYRYFPEPDLAPVIMSEEKIARLRASIPTLPDERKKVYIEKYGFEKVYDTDIIIDGFWILSHEPKYVNKNFPYANIFAHENIVFVDPVKYGINNES